MNKMNDIAKQRTVDKFKEALKNEQLSKGKAGFCIRLNPAQVSYLFNPKYWDRLGNKGWDVIRDWVNSGETLLNYGKRKKEAPKKEKVKEEKFVDPAFKTPFNNVAEKEMDIKEVTRKAMAEPKNNVLDFIRAHGCRVVGKDPDVHYYYLPYWYKVTVGQDKFELLLPDQLPDDLIQAVYDLINLIQDN